MTKTAKTYPHAGSSFDDFLQEDGIFEEVQARALKRALAEQLDDAMQSNQLSTVRMAERMATSRSQLDRVQDSAKLSIQLDTLIKAAPVKPIQRPRPDSPSPAPRTAAGTARSRRSLVAP